MGAGFPSGVFVDANVWFSRTRRDWIGMLYTLPDEPPFQVYWTEDIMAELVHSLRKSNPAWDGGRITEIRDRLAGTFEVGRVAHFSVDGSYGGRDPHDAHVHAAATACGAHYPVTCNVNDFRWDRNESHYEVLHPDHFLVLVHDPNPELVAQCVRRMSDYWFKRQGWSDLPQQLRTAECPAFAERVRARLQRMA